METSFAEARPAMNTPVCESFSIHFIGPAFKAASISTIAIGQSLLALDALFRKAAEAAYGPNARSEIEMGQGLEPASFTAELRLGVTERTVVEVLEVIPAA